MLQKTGIIVIFLAILCFGGCRQEEPELSDCSYLSYDSLEDFQKGIQECKQKKANEAPMTWEEIFLSGLTEYLYPQTVPEEYALLRVEVVTSSLHFIFIPEEHMPQSMDERVNVEQELSFYYTVNSLSDRPLYEERKESMRLEPIGENTLYVEDWNEVSVAVGNDLFAVRGYNVYQGYEALLPLCKYQVIPVANP